MMMSQQELNDILDAHAKWYRGGGGERVKLISADLRDALLGNAYLCNVILRRADLSGAHLRGAILRRADLSSANLRGADLRDADLRDADLCGADLRNADLRDADLRGAYLRRTDLSDAILRGADLRDADFSSADLSRAVGADLAIARTRILNEGDVIGWKKCRYGDIVKLRVPAEAKRSHAFGRKCRAEFVDVLEVIGSTKGISQFDGCTIYRAGERVHCDEWCDDWTKDCAGGIHFFITREEAEAY